jgi:hypothetical protein
MGKTGPIWDNIRAIKALDKRVQALEKALKVKKPKG